MLGLLFTTSLRLPEGMPHGQSIKIALGYGDGPIVALTGQHTAFLERAKDNCPGEVDALGRQLQGLRDPTTGVMEGFGKGADVTMRQARGFKEGTALLAVEVKALACGVEQTDIGQGDRNPWEVSTRHSG